MTIAAASALPCDQPKFSTPVFDPADVRCWLARGRSHAHARALADAWQRFPDLPPDAPLERRMARTRERVATLQPLHEAIAAETERARRRANFAFVERRLAEGDADPRYPAILRARDTFAFDWDDAVRFAEGWHAARAGCDSRPPREPQRAAAYGLGFREGGGCPDDLFDTARRAFAATPAAALRPRAAPAAARPLPSHWPKPTDAPRPAAWTRRLLLIGRQEAEGGALGVLAMLRTCAAHDQATVLVADPASGFVRCDPASGEAIGSPEARLGGFLDGHEYYDILIVADDAALSFLDAHAALLPLARTMERTRNSAIQQRAQFKDWLARGRTPGETSAGGHIRWSKMAQGLSGRLGDFVARYEGPAQPRGHRILVRTADGALASGFRTALGDALDPEIIISNRARLRDSLAAALRQFAAAIRLP